MYYPLKINLLIKYNTAIISILPSIIKIIRATLVKPFKSIKLRFSVPYNDEETVLVSVNMDNLNEFSKSKLSKVKILDKTNIAIMNKVKTKKDIFESSSLILISERNKLRLKMFIGFTNL